MAYMINGRAIASNKKAPMKKKPMPIKGAKPTVPTPPTPVVSLKDSMARRLAK